MNEADTKKKARRTASMAAAAYIGTTLAGGRVPEENAIAAIATLVRMVDVLTLDTPTNDFERDVKRVLVDYRSPNEYLAMMIGEQYPEELKKVMSQVRK